MESIDKIPFVDTPLHEAVAAGHDDFTMEIMNLMPSFARKLNKDSYSPIHLALKNETTVLRLLAADKDLVHVKGREGYTPLHCVAEQGNLRLLAQFLMDCLGCIQDVTIRNETALHVAAKKNKLKALQVLMQLLRRTYFYSSSFGKRLLNVGIHLVEDLTLCHASWAELLQPLSNIKAKTPTILQQRIQ